MRSTLMSDYLLLDTDPKQVNRVKGVKTMSKNNVPKVTNINDMRTSSILWFVTKKHKFEIAVLWGVVITTLYLVQFLPTAINNVRG